MKNYRLHNPEGFKDISGKLADITKIIEARLLGLYRSHGYLHVITPTLEYDDVYKVNEHNMDLYKLINRQGEVLALRNDMTLSICRHVAAMKKDFSILKYSYVSETFRYPRMYQGKPHEFLQAGIELISNDEFISDVEAILLAHKSLSVCGVKDYKLHLGSNEFISLLLDDFNISDGLKKDIYKAIAIKDFVLLRELVKNADLNIIYDLTFNLRAVSELDSLFVTLADKSCLKALTYIKKLASCLNELGVKDIVIDFSICSYAYYYTGIVFQFYLSGISHEVISGGRSNSVLKDFGKNYKDVGFGVDVDALSLYVNSINAIDVLKTKYLAITDDLSMTLCVGYKDSLQDDVIFNIIGNIDNPLEYAKENGYSRVIIFENKKLKEILYVDSCA